MKRSGGNWMGPTIYVDYDRSTGKAKIIDGVIDHYMGSPVVTSKIAESAKKISFKYKLGDVKGSATNASGVSYANQSYRLSIFKPSMKAVITMTPLGYSNTFRDTGRCQIKD
ncbi:hypothetical protein [Aliiroseovarius halocynthiae]|uniref:Uncharacterized protein n=2 Tax=Aliiroseovarius halocynthiae TaxID=985055 RepID=A0A545SWZ9_9RHOB|nr:hypothetical protein [Aliiroseovarius halocynthiae]TQV69492.1 hypothetical protein FIL88_08090 [Aliiroseovarius halocynthiae]